MWGVPIAELFLSAIRLALDSPALLFGFEGGIYFAPAQTNCPSAAISALYCAGKGLERAGDFFVEQESGMGKFEAHYRYERENFCNIEAGLP